ncbi:MAG: hypothetical protein J6Y65_00165 [Eggerthellaceae bacterium]|nr:hypothetical protein [Eggerthellaceae bacterium]
MLFILTGEKQSGKTRWLEAVVSKLDASDIPVCGVLAPGTWNDNLEKTAIDNLLLPEGERFEFGIRRDLVETSSDYAANPLNLGWLFYENALARTNAHLKSLAHTDGNRFLIIDELGPTELNKAAGIIEGLNLIDAGENNPFLNALIVVRSSLRDLALKRFGDKWDTCVIKPDDKSMDLLLSRLSE